MDSRRQVALLIERYERIAKQEVGSLKRVVQQITEFESSGKNAQHLRSQATRIEDQLLSGIEQILSTREKLDPEMQEEFDIQIEPIRKLIQTTVNTLRQTKLEAKGVASLTEATEEEVNVYAEEMDLQMSASKRKNADLKLKLEETKRMTEESKLLEADIQDLNDIFNQLQTLVYEQHNMVDSIEEHVEQATNDVQRGNEQLKNAVKSKHAKVPLITAVVGGLALGGPVGLAAGSAIAGAAAAVGGAFAGLYGGRWIKKSNSQ